MFALDDLLNTHGDDALLAIGTIVGHDENLVGVGTHLVLEDDEILGTGSQNHDDTVACLVHSLHNGKKWSNADTTAATNHGAILLNVGSVTERTDNIGQLITHLQRIDTGRAGSNGLNHEGDGTLLGVSISNGKRNSFAFLIETDNDEMSGFATLGNQRSLDLKTGHLLAEHFLAYDLKHYKITINE